MRLSFQLGNSALVQDPCYDRDTVENKVLTAPGMWMCEVDYTDNGFVSQLIAWHHEIGERPNGFTQRLPFMVDSDSGQVGIFDNATYPEGDTGDVDDDSFYSKVCALSACSEGWGVLMDSVCASSGHGDGSYEAFAIMKRKSPMVVAIKIVFIKEK